MRVALKDRYAYADGIPIRQGPGLFRPEDIDEFTLSYDMQVKTFDLGVPEQLEEYRGVLDKIANGEAHKFGKLYEPEWNTRTNSYHVLVRWGMPFKEVPMHLRDRLIGGRR